MNVPQLNAEVSPPNDESALGAEDPSLWMYDENLLAPIILPFPYRSRCLLKALSSNGQLYITGKSDNCLLRVEPSSAFKVLGFKPKRFDRSQAEAISSLSIVK